MLIANLSRTLFRFHSLFLKSSFARKVRQTNKIDETINQQPPQIISDQSQISKMRWQQKREKSIMSVGKRAFRQEQQNMERQIMRLMNQNKTDKQIIQQLSKGHRQEPQIQHESPEIKQDPFKGKQNFFRKQLGLSGKLTMPETLEYQQQVMLEHIKKQTQREVELRGKFYKNKNEQQQNQNNRIPDEFLEDVEKFKNNEVKYLTNLVERKTDHNKGLKKRREKGLEYEPKQIQTTRPQYIQTQAKDIVYVQSENQKIQKLTQNYEEVQATDNKQFIQKGALDLKLAQKNSNLYLREDIRKLMKPYEPKNSFSVQQSRIDKFDKMLKQQGFQMDIEQIKNIQKQTLFESKNNLQQLQLFRKRLEKRLKRKKIKQLSNKINQQQYTDKHQTKQLYKPLDFNLKKHKLQFDMIDHDKVNQINKNYAKSMFSAESRKVDHLDMHTEYNMKQWIWQQLIDGNSNRIAPIFDKIVVEQIFLNESNTTVTLIWKFGDKIKMEDKIDNKLNEDVEEVAKAQELLDRSATYMSGIMCQDLKLRFGPLIKFKHKKVNLQAEKAKKQMLGEMPIIIKQKLKQQISKGVLPSKMKQKDLYKVISTMQTSYEQRINQINFNTASQNQTKQKVSKKEKIRNNRNEDGSRKKRPKRVNSADQFWNQL